MSLPDVTGETVNHTIEFSDHLSVTFQLRLIPGAVFDAVLDAHRNGDGKASVDDCGPALLTHGVRAVYSSVESKPVPWELATRERDETPDAFAARVTDHPDAVEVWDVWPEWARMSLYGAVVAYSTKGPAADPFSRSKTKPNDDD